MATRIVLVGHDALTPSRTAGLRALFDAEYLDEYGAWDPDQPYGYAPAELHVIAVTEGRIVGHVGTQRRLVGVGDRDVLVAGTGGVLVDPTSRGVGLATRLVHVAQEAMRTTAPADFGLLGCREAVVPFYLRAGWTRIRVAERGLSRLDGSATERPAGPPALIAAARSPLAEWPEGDIDLRGRPW